MNESRRTQGVDPARNVRLGLLGGTFNPIHLGHLRVAEEVRESLGLDRVLFIPSAIPPHKIDDAVDSIAAADLRLDWVERATACQPLFSVDRVEIDRSGPSFLVDTLEQIAAREPAGTKTVFIVGEDAFSEMGDWREPQRIFAMSDLAVMTRPPGRLEDLSKRIPAIVREAFRFENSGRGAVHEETGARIDLVEVTALDISSSAIRRALRNGESIRFLVPEAIRPSIEDCQAYAPNQTSGERRKRA